MKLLRVLLPAAACLLVTPVLAADWPQWRGPDRTNISKETGLLKAWPKDGPKLLWTFENAGAGFSGPAVVGSKLYTLGARDNKELLIAVDTKSGKELWTAEVGPQFNNGWGDGPRSSPTVDGSSIYVLGGQGNLVCIDTNGKKVWSKSMQKDFGGQVMSGWGYCESPLVDGDRLICTPGGKNGTLAALDKKTGNPIWRSVGLNDATAYSSIIIAEMAGTRMYIQMTGAGVVGVAAKDGKPLWSSPEGKNGTAIIPTPIFHDNHVYVSSGYGCGCALVKLTADGGNFKAEKVYANKTMTNHHGGVLKVGDHVYGFSDGKGWICQDFKTGTAAWEEKKGLGKGSVTCVDGMLYCYGERDGRCVLIEATPTGWKAAGEFKLPRETKLNRKKGQIWTHPVVADGKLYLRDQDLVFCFDVKAATADAR